MRPLSQEHRCGVQRRSSPLQALPVAILLGANAGCILPSPSFDEYASDSAAPSSSASVTEASDSASATTSSTSSTSSTVGGVSSDSDPSATGSSTSSGPTSTSSSTSTGEPTTGGGETYPVDSCAKLKDYLEENGLPVVSDIYTIELPQVQTPTEVYCDMDIFDGGWLLVGRSTASSEKGNFGWRSSRGDLHDDDAPYSLGLHTSPFPFTEILIGTWSAGKTWGENVYNYGVPSDFVSAHENDLVPTTYFEEPKGDCNPVGGPAMLMYAGATANPSAFFFRDTDQIDAADYGLLHDMIWTYYTEEPDLCPRGGKLATHQGMLMVR